MIGWLAAVAERAEEPRNRFARRIVHWFQPAAAVPTERFQDEDEPYPGHWRHFPERWRRDAPTDAEVADALGTLPPLWREVLVARDVLGVDAEEISRRHGLTAAQQRAMLNKARAAVRERLSEDGQR